MHEAVIVGMARTPIGRFQGGLSSFEAPQLGSIAIRGALQNAGIDPGDVSEVLMGQVFSAGAGAAPARQAGIAAGIPPSVPCMTINKVCGSGLKAVMLARQAIRLGEADIVVAGGMESMSNAPYLLPGARTGMRMGDSPVVDSLLHDGLLDPFSNAHIGTLGDRCAEKFGLTREEQDAYARRSYERALRAQKECFFAGEIVPVEISGRKGKIVIGQDEEPAQFNPEKMGKLPPAFSAKGTVTAANASKISDGATALVLVSRETAEKRKIPIIAAILSDATHAHEPEWFTTAPISAIRKAVKKAGLDLDDVDVFEINEAFSAVAMAAIKELSLKPERVNMHGGAVSLGHPIGCSGARILVTLLNVMRRYEFKTGCASPCIGGGESVAVVVQREE